MPARPAGKHGATLAAAAALLWLLVVCSGPVHAARPSTSATDQAAASVWAAQQSELCAVALRQAEQRYHLPPALLASIARAESGRPITSLTDVRPWPWTIDADGTGLFLDSKAAAIAWMRATGARHSFVDVGCMQVDLHYHPDAFTSMEDAFDPAANADYAARLLVDLYRGEAGGSWDIAVGLYHSHTPLLAAEYRDRVALIGADVLHGVSQGRAALCARHSSRHAAAATGRRQGGVDQRAPPTGQAVTSPIHHVPDRADSRSLSERPAQGSVRRSGAVGETTVSDVASGGSRRAVAHQLRGQRHEPCGGRFAAVRINHEAVPHRPIELRPIRGQNGRILHRLRVASVSSLLLFVSSNSVPARFDKAPNRGLE